MPTKTCLALLALLALALPASPRPQGEAAAQEQSPEAARIEALQKELEAIQLELAADPAPEPARMIRLRLKEGDHLQDLGRLDDSVTSYEQGAALARELPDDNLLAICLGNVAQSCFFLGRYKQGRAACEEAVVLAQTLGRGDHLWRLANTCGALDLRLADFPAALSAFELALEHLPPDDPGSAGLLYNNLANAYMNVGEHKRASDMLDQALPLLEKYGGPLYVSAVYSNRADLLVLTGDNEGALAPQLEALRLRQEAHADADVAQSLVGLGRIHFSLGRMQEAKTEFERALEIQKALNLRGDQTTTLGGLAETYAKLGQGDLADSSAKEGLALAIELGAEGQRIEMLHSLAKVQESQGKYEDALSTLRDALVLERAINGADVRQRTAELKQSIELAQERSKAASERQQRLAEELAHATRLAQADSELAAERQRNLEADLERSTQQARTESELADERARHLADLRRGAGYGAGILLTACAVGWVLYWSKRKTTQRLGAALDEISGLQDERIRAAKFESLGMLAGGIAHDFNNALTVVLGNVSLARRGLADQPELVAELEASEAAIDQASRLARQLLAHAATSGESREICDLGPLLREASTMACSGSSARLELDVADDLWLAEVDRGQIMQVFSNLVLNAVQAMPNGGEVTLSARNVKGANGSGKAPSAPAVRIEVEDTGPGIREDMRMKVFDPFFTTKPTGTGIGLTTVRAIIDRHAGDVRLERAPGGGARFVVELPAAPDALLPVLPARPAEDESSLGPGRILVLDDEAALRLLYERMLTRLGLEFVLADDGASAIAEYRRAQASGRPFDLLILDLTLPGGNGGLAVLEAVRALDPGVRALVASGYSDSGVLADPVGAGFTGALAKPFTLAELARALRAALPQRADRTSARARSRS